MSVDNLKQEKELQWRLPLLGPECFFQMSRANTITGADNQHFEGTALGVEGSKNRSSLSHLEDKVPGSGIRHEESDAQGSVTTAPSSTSILHQNFPLSCRSKAVPRLPMYHYRVWGQA